MFNSSKHNQPAISFLVCTRNRADTVRSCVLNLLNSGRSDIEVIVRDNCSTDATVKVLSGIKDSRLKVFLAPENQGTRSFFEISKLASGRIVTWLSDEDDFQFDCLDYIISKFEDPTCNVMFGSIIVGESARSVRFADEVINDPVRSNITALLFSGCGGLFIRKAALHHAHSFNISNENDAYMVWNYYPVGFFSTRCLYHSLVTTSQVVVKQSRFADTTNNWNVRPESKNKVPHYYPESVFDRMSSNVANICFKNLPVMLKILLVFRIVRWSYQHTNIYYSTDFIKLLKENYNIITVQNYISHIKYLKLDRPFFKMLWFFKMTFKMLLKTYSTRRCWRKIMVN